MLVQLNKNRMKKKKENKIKGELKYIIKAIIINIMYIYYIYSYHYHPIIIENLL